ncbi:hypothetical protein M3147_05390 [Agromyces mediolanus]|uniref:hypothetical protein n=1 Tax=Agromyces mediolanus TaxID=41986 RepID=UPI00203B43AD|nr:hypothetical protein [Agromyces mediolanus]MCM3656683.1 hypothetical protein [Agromyces mediolanus]
MRVGIFGAVVAAALMLTGCTAEPAPTPTPSPSAAPAESPTPTPTPSADPLASVDALVIRPTALELRAGEAVVETLDYMSEPAAAVATLTELFGRPPVDEAYQGGNHWPDGVYHRWGGFVLDERFYDEERRQRDGHDWLVWPRFAVFFDGTVAETVSLRSLEGSQIGDEWAVLAELPSFDPDLVVCNGVSIEAEPIETPRDRPARVSVVAVKDDDDGTVQWISAPEIELERFGGCA